MGARKATGDSDDTIAAISYNRNLYLILSSIYMVSRALVNRRAELDKATL